MTDPALPHRTAENEPRDDRPSIAELQAMEIDPERSCARCRQTMEAPTDSVEPTAVCHSCAQNIVADVLPVLIEIVAAALQLHDQERDAAKARFRVYAQLGRNEVPSDEDYAATDVADRLLKTYRDAYDAALSKVRR